MSSGRGDDDRHRRELEAFHAIVVATGSGDDLALTAERTLEVVCGVARVPVGGVFRLDRAARTLVLVAHRGLLPDDVERLRVRPLDQSHIGEVIRRGGPVVTDLTASSVLTPGVAERVRIGGYRTQLALPIPVNGETWGVMALISREARTFEADELTLLQAVAHQVGQAVARAALLAEGREKSRRLETLAHLAQTLTATLSLDDVFGRVVDAAIELFGSSAAELWLVDDDAEHVSRRAAAGLQSSARAVGRMRRGEGLVGTVVATREPLTALDAPNDPRARNVERVRAEGLVSVAIVPLQSAERVLGALAIGVRARHEYTTAELQLLGSLASHAANAITNARHYQEATRQAQRMSALADLARLVSETLDFDPAAQRVADSVCTLLDARASCLYRFDPASGGLVAFATSRGDDQGFYWEPVLPRGTGIAGLAVSQGRSVASADVLADPRIAYPDDTRARLLGEARCSLLAVPLMVQGRMFGALAVSDRAGRTFDESEIRLARAFADQAALALENARLYTEARRRRREAEELARLARTLTESLDPHAVGDRIADSVLALFQVRSSVLRLLQPDGSLLTLSRGGRPRGGPQLGLVLRAGVGAAGRAVIEGRPVASTDIFNDPSIVLSAELAATMRDAGDSAVLSVPLRVKDRIIGALTLADRTGRVFSEAEVALLQAFADQAALALENARLFDERTRAYGELAAAQDQLVRTEKLRALGEMASGVAHDFNNLLASILGRAQLTLQRLQDPQLRKWIQVIERSALDGAQTVRRLQEFTRTRRDQPFVAVDLNEVVRGALDITQSRWREETRSRGVTVEVQTSFGRVPQVSGDPAELREGMTNLILNAVDAMPAGGTLTLTTALEGPDVVVTVADTGVGIPEAIRSKIFDPFFTTKGPQGTGLGLSMTYGILSRHGARVTVESHEGRGTTFRLAFTPGGAAVGVEPGPGVEPPAPGVSLHCLVVDDEEAVGTVLGDVLRAAGHRVEVLTDGGEAIARFRAERFDVVLTDLAMPRVSGWQVAQAVKAIAPAVPVVLVTGFGVELSAEERRTHGVDLVVVKPLKIKDVLDVVARVCRQRAQRP